MGSSGLLSLPRPGDFGPLSVKIPCASTGPNVNANSGIGREREAQLVRRVRELEEEVRVLRVDSDKQVRFFPLTFFVLHGADEAHRKR